MHPAHERALLLSRRHFFGRTATGIGTAALASLLGRDAVVTALVVEWPSGTRDRVTNVASRQFLTIEEGKGVVAHASGGGK